MIYSKDSSRSRRVKASLKEEQRVASALGGKRLIASGAFKSKLDGSTARGDITAQGFWIEQKSTESPMLRISLAWLQKVKKGAFAQAQWPALSITFQRLHISWIGFPGPIYQQVCQEFYPVSLEHQFTTGKQSIALEGALLQQLQKQDHAGISIQFEGLDPWIFIPLERFATIMEARRE